MSDVFLTPGNFANLLTQAASVTVIAMGLIFVLLLGEIDLSAGYASGVTGAVLVILVTNHGWPWYAAFGVSLVVGAALGYSIGLGKQASAQQIRSAQAFLKRNPKAKVLLLHQGSQIREISPQIVECPFLIVV